MYFFVETFAVLPEACFAKESFAERLVACFAKEFSAEQPAVWFEQVFAAELPADVLVQDGFEDVPPVVAAVSHFRDLQKRVSVHLPVSCTPGWSEVAAGWVVYMFWALLLYPVFLFAEWVAAVLYTWEFVLPDSARGWVQYNLKVCARVDTFPAEFAADVSVQSLQAECGLQLLFQGLSDAEHSQLDVLVYLQVLLLVALHPRVLLLFAYLLPWYLLQQELLLVWLHELPHSGCFLCDFQKFHTSQQMFADYVFLKQDVFLLQQYFRWSPFDHKNSCWSHNYYKSSGDAILPMHHGGTLTNIRDDIRPSNRDGVRPNSFPSEDPIPIRIHNVPNPMVCIPRSNNAMDNRMVMHHNPYRYLHHRNADCNCTSTYW